MFVRQFHHFKNTYVDFSNNTGIHGLKYITEEGRRIVERVLWVLFVIVGLLSSILMASTFWSRFSASSTRASVETRQYPVWKLPFPAVTICNANLISLQKAQALVQKLQLPADMTVSEALDRLVLLGDLMKQEPERSSTPEQEELAKFQQLLEKQNYTVYSIMKDLHQNCGDLMELCRWEGETVPCMKLFEERKTDMGICCSFNYMGVTEKTENNKMKLQPVEREVIHTGFANFKMGLTVLANPQIHDFFATSMFSAGIRVLVHNPHNFPDNTAVENIVQVDREVMLRMTATSTYSMNSLREMSPETRGCLLPGERKLIYFPVYSEVNCVTECRQNYTLSLCGCTPFFYPDSEWRLTGFLIVPHILKVYLAKYSKKLNDMPLFLGEHRICNLQDIPCLNDNFYTLRTRDHMDGDDDDHVSADASIACDCPPSCSDIIYKVKTSVGDFQASRFQINPYLVGYNLTGRSLFHLYFGTMVTLRTQNDIINTWNDLLSSLGGIFSLFLGFSFISVIEMLYFFLFRLLFRWKISLSSVKPSNENFAQNDKIIPITRHMTTSH